MAKKYVAVVALVACVAFKSAFAAVGENENLLLNGRFEADQAVLPPFWGARPADQVTWKPSGGPNGLPYVTLQPKEGKKNEVNFRQYGLRLAEGGRYRISAYVRTAGFSARGSGVSIVNNWWRKSAGAGTIPADTAGQWVKLEQEFDCFESDNGAYSLVIFALGHKGEFSVADVSLVAVDALAREKTERSPVLAAQSVPSVVPFSPLLGKIPRSNPVVEFRFFGELPKGRTAADYVVCLERDGSDEVSRVTLDATEAMKIAVPAAASAEKGVLTVSIKDRTDGKALFSEKFRYAMRDVPQVMAKGRRLNNFTVELVKEKYAGGAPASYAFDMVKDGWVFVKAGDGGASVKLDGVEIVSSATPRGESFRNIRAGRHAIEVSGGAADVVVRAIADIFNYCPGANSHVKENGRYDWNFQEKYVLPAVTTQNGGSIPKDKLEGFLSRGYRWVANLGTTGVSADDLVKKLKESPGMTKHGYAGVTCDEQFLHRANEINAYTKGLKAYDLECAPSRVIYTWSVGKPSTKVVDENFFSACVNASLGEGRVLFEAYCRTKETESEAREYLKSYITDTISRYRSTYPLSVGATCIALGNFMQVPILSLAHHPEVDYKYYLDMQMNMVANDPAFEGLGSIGYWGSYYADEEIHRWCFALTRHYVVEGRKTMLSDRFGYSYRPDHILNGDFRGNLDSWKVSGNVRTDSFADFAMSSQNRWGGNGGIGDTFAVLARGKDSSATIRQTAKNLVPGRKYRLRYAAFDAKDVKAKRVAPRKFAVAASLGKGAEIDKALTWTHVDMRVKGRYGQNDGCARINLGQIVFTAEASEVEVLFDNSSAKEGEELGINYVSLTPYYGNVL